MPVRARVKISLAACKTRSAGMGVALRCVKTLMDAMIVLPSRRVSERVRS